QPGLSWPTSGELDAAGRGVADAVRARSGRAHEGPGNVCIGSPPLAVRQLGRRVSEEICMTGGYAPGLMERRTGGEFSGSLEPPRRAAPLYCRRERPAPAASPGRTPAAFWSRGRGGLPFGLSGTISVWASSGPLTSSDAPLLAASTEKAAERLRET